MNYLEMDIQQLIDGLLERDAEIQALRDDAKRLDWLANIENTIGNVQLPTECVTDNVHSLRDAIDAAMRLQP